MGVEHQGTLIVRNHVGITTVRNFETLICMSRSALEQELCGLLEDSIGH